MLGAWSFAQKVSLLSHTRKSFLQCSQSVLNAIWQTPKGHFYPFKLNLQHKVHKR